MIDEGVDTKSIFVTGNTAIDALKMVVDRPRAETSTAIMAKVAACVPNDQARFVLMTAHRRENLGETLVAICRGVKELVARNPTVVVVYPVHLNPNVRSVVTAELANTERVILTPPLDYDVMAQLMGAADFVLTDSGGLQEEAPALGIPVLVLRSETERVDAIDAGGARLIGVDVKRIVEESERLLHDRAAYERMATTISPYGDGHAAHRIVEILLGNKVEEVCFKYMKIRFYNTYEPVTSHYRDLIPHLARAGHQVEIVISSAEYREGRDLAGRLATEANVRMITSPSFGLRVQQNLPAKVIVTLSYFLWAIVYGLFGPRADVNVFLTQPPLILLLGSALLFLRRQPYLCIVMDIYPQIAVALGLTRADAWYLPILERLSIGRTYPSPRRDRHRSLYEGETDGVGCIV